MEVRPYDHETDYPILRGWWRAWNPEDADPAHTLSPFGGVVEDDEGPIMAGFVYMSVGCGVCFFDRMVGRPGCLPVDLRDAAQFLIEYLQIFAVGNDYKLAYARIERDGMVRELEKLGFCTIGKGITIMGKLIE